jgi:glycosyltransferase involved in cell wall biosynthesis
MPIALLHHSGCVQISWLTRRPLLAHLHIDYLRRSRYVLLLHMANMIVGVSRQVTDGFLDDGVPPERLRVIYNGIDFARLPPAKSDLRAKLGINVHTPIIATMGSLIRRKGHDLLIRAVANLQSQAQAPHLILGSDGEARPELEALTRSLGIQDRTHFLGYTDDPVAVYKAANIFSLASRADAFGLVLAEAGHFGLPLFPLALAAFPK